MLLQNHSQFVDIKNYWTLVSLPGINRLLGFNNNSFNLFSSVLLYCLIYYIIFSQPYKKSSKKRKRKMCQLQNNAFDETEELILKVFRL